MILYVYDKFCCFKLHCYEGILSMSDFINRIFRIILVVIFTVIGLVMAFTLIISALLAVGVLYIVALVRGKPFSAKGFMKKSSTRAKETSQSFGSKFQTDDAKDSRIRKPDPSDITDVEFKDVK